MAVATTISAGRDPAASAAAKLDSARRELMSALRNLDSTGGGEARMSTQAAVVSIDDALGALAGRS